MSRHQDGGQHQQGEPPGESGTSLDSLLGTCPENKMLIVVVMQLGQWICARQPDASRPTMQSGGQRHPLHIGDAAQRVPDHRVPPDGNVQRPSHQHREFALVCLFNKFMRRKSADSFYLLL